MRQKEVTSSISFDFERRRKFEDGLNCLGAFDSFYESGESDGQQIGLGSAMVDTKWIESSDLNGAVSLCDIASKWCDIELSNEIIIDFPFSINTDAVKMRDIFMKDFARFNEQLAYRWEYMLVPASLYNKCEDDIEEILIGDDRQLNGLPGLVIRYDRMFGGWNVIFFAGRISGMKFWNDKAANWRREYLDQIIARMADLIETRDDLSWRSSPQKNSEKASMKLSVLDSNSMLTDVLHSNLPELIEKLFGGSFTCKRRCVGSDLQSIRHVSGFLNEADRMHFGRVTLDYGKLFSERCKLEKLEGFCEAFFNMPIGSAGVAAKRVLFYWDFKDGDCRLVARCLDDKFSPDDLKDLEDYVGINLS